MIAFNLIATTDRGAERRARRELLDLLYLMGDEAADAVTVSLAGLVLAQTSLNPFDVVSGIASKFRDDPLSVRYLIRVIPIEVLTDTDPVKIAECVERLKGKIGVDESFRVTVEKRRTTLHSMEIVKAVAARVDRRVDLENPDWIILVEVVGEVSGISVLRPGQIFHAFKQSS